MRRSVIGGVRGACVTSDGAGGRHTAVSPSCLSLRLSLSLRLISPIIFDPPDRYTDTDRSSTDHRSSCGKLAPSATAGSSRAVRVLRPTSIFILFIFIMSGTKEEDRKGSSEWREFFWNPRTHELMGRTASSWGLILLFYLIFYLFLAGMFVLTMYIMLLTLDEYKPTWQDRLATPGMMIRPKGDQLEISFSVSNTESWDGFVQNLNTFLSPYNDSYQVQTNDNCPPDQYFIQEDSGEVRNNPKRSCQFNRTMLEDCSGFTDRYYGYSRGQPCILIKLNRVIGMLPGKDGQSPYVTCGAKREDSDKIGPLMYFPANGTFNLMYYPYYGKKAQVNYTQPLVAVKFLNASLNTDINVECKINSNTLAGGSERDKFAGRVSFKLRIDDK